MQNLNISTPRTNFTGADLQAFFIWNGEPIDGFTAVDTLESLECTSEYQSYGSKCPRVVQSIKLTFAEYEQSPLITYPLFNKFDILIFGMHRSGEASYSYYSGCEIKKSIVAHSSYQLGGSSIVEFTVEGVVPWKPITAEEAENMFGDFVNGLC